MDRSDAHVSDVNSSLRNCHVINALYLTLYSRITMILHHKLMIFLRSKVQPSAHRTAVDCSRLQSDPVHENHGLDGLLFRSPS